MMESETEIVNQPMAQTVEEKLALAKTLKGQGNEFYSKKQFKEAIRQYHKALLYVKAVENDATKFVYNSEAVKVAENILEENKKLKIDCLNNLAASLLQTSDSNMEKVVSYCDEVLKNAPSNDKALFRKSQALFKLGDFDSALVCGMEASKLQNSSDPKVTHLISQCQSKLATQHSKEKTLYTNMLGLK